MGQAYRITHAVHESQPWAIACLRGERPDIPIAEMRRLREKARDMGDLETVALWSRCVWLALHPEDRKGRIP